jgi:hypothetical protein
LSPFFLFKLNAWLIRNWKNVVIIIFSVGIMFKFVIGLNSKFNVGGFFISFVLSFLISMFVLDKFKLSDNLIINILQRFLLLLFVYLLLLLFGSYIGLDIFNTVVERSSDKDISELTKGKDVLVVNSEGETGDKNYNNFKIDKNLADTAMITIGQASKIAFDQVVPNLGASATAGSDAAAAYKASAGLPPTQRLATVMATTIVTTASTKVGLEIGKNLANNSNIMDSIKNYKHSDTNIERVPSPGNDDPFVNSPFEDGIINLMSPMENLIMYQFILNIIIFVLILILIYLFLSRFFFL